MIKTWPNSMVQHNTSRNQIRQAGLHTEMLRLRLWSVRHARLLERIYDAFERILIKINPLLEWIGHDRLEKPFAALERITKGLFFDCQMCGQCILSSTGMSCPMNCPKTLRNGPCGGVRPGGFCEIKPAMRCVWVEAWEGSLRMRNRDAIHALQPPVDARLKGRSAWLRAIREKAGKRNS
jgi:hypothetical protein